MVQVAIRHTQRTANSKSANRVGWGFGAFNPAVDVKHVALDALFLSVVIGQRTG